MSNDAVSFTVAIDGWLMKTGLTADDVVRRIALQVWQELVKRTPVDTGRARQGWVTNLDEPSEEAPPAGSYGQPAPPDLSRATIRNRVFIVNNVPYCIELDQGSSQKAPAGMVAVTMAQVQAEFEKIIAGAAHGG